MMENDPVLATALDLTVDVATANGYTLTGTNARQTESAQKLFDDVLDFDRVVDNIIYQLILYGNSFMEIVRTDKWEIHPLPPTEMAITYDVHGKILGYVQKPQGKKATEVSFAPEDVIYFRLKWIGNKVESYSPLKPISRSFVSKILANEYLQSIFKHLPPKALHVLKTASREQREAYIANLIRAKRNPGSDIIATGDADVKMLVPEFNGGLLEILKFLREEVLMVTRVPPIFVGLPDNSNRSSSEAMSIPFETRVRKIQSIISSQINKELLPKLGLTSVKFRFNPPSLADETAIITVARQMKDMGMDSETIISYLRKKGFHTLPETSFIEMGVMNKDLMPSRQRMNKKTDKMSNNLNEKGVSEEGAQKLEQKQMETRSAKWYIEPVDQYEEVLKDAS